jgi:signal transduction histidine kinase
VITEFRILNEKILPGDPGSPLSKPIYETDTLVLSHLQNTFSFEFVALSYTNAESNEYAYKLENFDEKWNEVRNRRFANYTNLPPGRYTFKVIGSNNDGYWNYEGKSIFIVITPPFWQTWLFYAFIVLAIVVLIYVIIYLRTRRLQRLKAVLEKLVKSRTLQMKQEKALVEKAHGEILFQKNEIERQHSLLKKKNKEITKAKSALDKVNEELTNINTNLENIVKERTYRLQNVNEQLIRSNDELDKFIYRASHDLKGPIARLLGLTMIAKMDKNEHDIEDYINLMQSNAFNMNRVINKLTNVHHINKREKEFKKVDLPILIHEIKQKLSKNIDIKAIDISISQPKGIELYTDPVLLMIILENLIENAVLFRRKKKAKVELNLGVTDDQYVLTVMDDGIGIPKAQHNKIFEMFFRASEKSYGNGLGLYLVNKAVERLHGNIHLESTENKFTTFTISFPHEFVDQDHEHPLLNH